MTLIIEEQKNKSVMGSLIWLVLLAGVGIGAYYLFFKKPELIKIPPPQEYEQTREISRLKLDPSEVVESARFKLLKPYINPLEPKTMGKSNPFLGFESEN